jgi:hypothetical protein
VAFFLQKPTTIILQRAKEKRKINRRPHDHTHGMQAHEKAKAHHKPAISMHAWVSEASPDTDAKTRTF